MSNFKLTLAEEIDFLLREKNEQRVEILEINRTFFKTFFAFLTTLGVFAGICLNGNLLEKAELRTSVLFIISQIQFIVVIFLLSLASIRNVNVGYVRALEKRINSLAMSNISIWESHVASEYINKPKGTSFLSQAVLYLFCLGGFSIVAFTCWQELSNKFVFFLYLYPVELIISLMLFFLSLRDIPRANKLACQLLGMKGKSSSDNELQGDSVKGGTGGGECKGEIGVGTDREKVNS